MTYFFAGIEVRRGKFFENLLASLGASLLSANIAKFFLDPLFKSFQKNCLILIFKVLWNPKPFFQERFWWGARVKPLQFSHSKSDPHLIPDVTAMLRGGQALIDEAVLGVVGKLGLLAGQDKACAPLAAALVDGGVQQLARKAA